jgi:hypothetical protein
MAPTLLPGDIVVAKKPGNVRVGKIVMALVNNREVIKRVAKIGGGKVYLTGDNSLASTDSRSYGEVPQGAIVGTIMAKIRLAKPTPASKVSNKKLLAVPYALAAFFALVLLVLLLRINTFVHDVDMLLANESAAKLTAAVAAVLLLFSLPFLIRMNLSPLMRGISALSTLLAPMVAMLVAPFIFIRNGSDYAFGSNVDTASIWSVAALAALFVIALWSFYILGGQHSFNRLKKSPR